MIVLDTHALVWWVNGDKKLSNNAAQAIQQENEENGRILISSITAWEIAMLVSKERLILTMNVNEWLRTVNNIDCIEFVPVDNEVSVMSVQLPGTFHADPADRIITALARQQSVPIVTYDSKIRDYKFVNSIW